MGRHKVDRDELIVVQKQLFYAFVVGVVEEREVFDVVVHQRQLSQSFNIVQVERRETAVVGEHELTFGCGGESQTTCDSRLENRNLLLEVVTLGKFLLYFALLKRTISSQRYL